MHKMSLTRTKSGAVVSQDLSTYEQIKRDRLRKKEEQSMREDLDHLKELVLSLQAEIKEMKRG